MLTEERNTARREGENFAHDLAAGAKVFMGHMVVLQAGYAKAGFADATLTTVGIAKETVDNTDGPDGGAKIIAETGTFKLANAADADAITRTDIGEDCFVLDAITVAKTDGTGTRSRAGVIRAVEGNGVWVTL